jgi:hypothetical protein
MSEPPVDNPTLRELNILKIKHPQQKKAKKMSKIQNLSDFMLDK